MMSSQEEGMGKKSLFWVGWEKQTEITHLVSTQGRYYYQSVNTYGL